MKTNVSFKEAIIGHVVMIAVVIIGGLMHNVWVMAMGVPMYLIGISGWSPLYSIMNIDHSEEELPE